MTQRLDAFLRAIPLFSDLDDSEMQEILLLMRPFSAVPGQTLCKQGDTADGMYIIESGSVKVTTRLLGDMDVALSTVEAGAILGEVSLIDGGTRSATAEAMEPTKGYFFSRRHFDLLRADFRPSTLKVMRKVCLLLCERLRMIYGEIAALPVPADLAAPSRPMKPGTIPGAQATPSAATQLDRTVLRGIRPFTTFDPGELDEIVTPLCRWECERGRVLFNQGDEPTSCFIVVRGAVQVAVYRGGVSQNIALLGPGKVVGHMELIDGGRRAATSFAREPSLLLELEQREFERLVYGGSSAALKFFDAVSLMLGEAVRKANRQLIRLASEVRDARISNRPPPSSPLA